MSSKKLQKTEIFQRIEELRVQEGYKFQGAFAKEIDISGSYYGEVKSGRSLINIDFILGIANKFPDADLRQILTGSQTSRVNDEPAEYQTTSNNKDVEELIQTLKHLDDAKRKHVLALINSLINLLFIPE